MVVGDKAGTGWVGKGTPSSGRVLRLISVVRSGLRHAQSACLGCTWDSWTHILHSGLQASLTGSSTLTGKRQKSLKSGLAQKIQARLLLFLEPLGFLQRAQRGWGFRAESGSAFPTHTLCAALRALDLSEPRLAVVLAPSTSETLFLKSKRTQVQATPALCTEGLETRAEMITVGPG